MEEKHKKSLKSSFIGEIQARILSGELKPGDRLPPEREMARASSISRGSVNQAVLDLERMGFLDIIPRKGTFVADFRENSTPETLSAVMSHDRGIFDEKLFLDFMQFRILVERECVRLIVSSLTFEKEKELLSVTGAVSDADETDAVDRVYEYHRCLTRISGNGAYFMVFQSFGKMMRSLISEHYENTGEVKKDREKIKNLTECIIRRDAEGADEAITSLLNCASDYLKKKIQKEKRR